MPSEEQRVKVVFRDFPERGPPRISRFLAQHYELEPSDDPDFTLFSCFGKRHLLDGGVRIFMSGENLPWDFEHCDFAFTNDFVDDERHLRWPTYSQALEDPSSLIKGDIDAEAVLRSKTGFCNFVYSNLGAKVREHFFHQLSKYKRIDAGGAQLNNLGYRVSDKRSFQARYKFTIAFENSSHPGYTTEKLTDPMLAMSLPIYWGNNLVHRDFNPKSFINCHDFGSFEEVIDRIIELDRDDDLYCNHLREPWYHGDRIGRFVDRGRILERFHHIFNRRPVHASPTLRERAEFTEWWIRTEGVLRVQRFARRSPWLHRPARFLWRASGVNALRLERKRKDFERGAPEDPTGSNLG